MNKKTITIIMSVLSAVLLGLCALVYLSEDKTGPEIQLSNVTVTYHETGDKNDLFAGVKAVDSRNGDVSDTLKIDRITEVQEGKYSVVTYIAKDKSNNISKKDRWINLIDGTTSEVPMLDAESTITVETELETESETQPETVRSGNLAGIQTASVSVTEAAENESETETETETETEGNIEHPVIRLTTNEVELSIGQSFDCMTYIAGCRDDVDTIDDLYRRIIVNGTDKNGNEVGTGTISTYSVNEYYLNYYVVDSDGNRSNVEKLTVTVK